MKVQNNERAKQQKCKTAEVQKYETTKVRNNERAKQRDCERLRDCERAMRNNDAGNNETAEQPKSDAKLQKSEAKQRNCETTILRNNERAMRNCETTKQRKGETARGREGDVKEGDFKEILLFETAKQRKGEMTLSGHHTIQLHVS